MPTTQNPRSRPEPTLALINIVFLMLIFFLVAGQVARPVARDIALVDASTAAAHAPDDALVLMSDGTLLWRGQPATAADFAAAQAPDAPLRILPDRDAPARDLIALAAALRADTGRAGTGRDVRLVTARTLDP